MVDEPTDNGWTPLLIMVWDGNENMVRFVA